MTPPKYLQKGQSITGNWKAINGSIGTGKGLMDEAGFLRGLRRLRGAGDVSTDAFPFRVYLPGRPTDDPAQAAWWRTFHVQHGYVGNFKTNGCDDADGEGTTATEIVIDAGVAAYYVWIEATLSGATVTAAEIKHGAAGWTDFPAQPADGAKFFVLLARIDTATCETERRAVVRQFAREDVVLSGVGAGSDARWS